MFFFSADGVGEMQIADEPDASEMDDSGRENDVNSARGDGSSVGTVELSLQPAEDVDDEP